MFAARQLPLMAASRWKIVQSEALVHSVCPSLLRVVSSFCDTLNGFKTGGADVCRV